MGFALTGTAGLLLGGAAVVGSIYAADKAAGAQSDAIDASLQSAGMQRDTAMETLAYYRERDAQSAGLQRQANAIAGRVANSQVALMNQQRDQSKQYFNRLKNTFWPVEDGLVTDALAYDTPERRQLAQSDAMAGVEQQLAMSRASTNRGLTRMGVNPNSSKFALTNNAMSLGEASAKAAAGRNASDQIENTGWGRRYDVTALGRGLPSNSTASAGASTSAGSAAVNAAMSPVQIFNQTTGATGGGMMNALSGVNAADNMAIGAYQNNANMWGGVSSGLGSLAGSFLGMGMAGRK